MNDQWLKIVSDLVAHPLLFVKIFFLIGLILYLAFAFIVWRQVKLMSRTIEGISETLVKMVSIIHLGVAVGVFILAAIIL